MAGEVHLAAEVTDPLATTEAASAPQLPHSEQKISLSAQHLLAEPLDKEEILIIIFLFQQSPNEHVGDPL